MAYELNAEGRNGVNDTTVVVALDNFAAPTPPTNTASPTPSKAVWLVDASALMATPAAGPVDGIQSLSGAGGGRGIFASGDLYGVHGDSSNVGVYGFGVNGVSASGQSDSQGNPGIAVVGQAQGSGVAGWARDLSISSAFDAFPTTSLSFLSGLAGVYGCVADRTFPPSDPNGPFTGVSAGVWGDAANEDAGSVGVFGTSQSGRGGVFQATNAAQLRLIPSTIPLEDNLLLLQNGQPGDLYLFSVSAESGTTGTYHYNTVLWLCIAPASPDAQATWAQIELGALVGGS
jgi:hypothetical protein